MIRWIIIAKNMANNVKIEDEIDAPTSEEALQIFNSRRKGLSIEIVLVESAEDHLNRIKSEGPNFLETKKCRKCGAVEPFNSIECSQCKQVFNSNEKNNDLLMGGFLTFFLCLIGSFLLTIIDGAWGGLVSKGLGFLITGIVVVANNSNDWRKGCLIGYLAYVVFGVLS